MQRISEELVSRVLWSIHAPPNPRRQPLPGDLAGHYDLWFDGGARQTITGSTHYYFQDGTRARVSVLPVLAIRIEFANGETVDVSQAE